MSKQPIYIPNGIYHVYNHANGWENIFKEDENYLYFLRKYKEKLNGVVKTLAYCLMPNHFHLLIKVRPTKNLFQFINTKAKTNSNLPKGLEEEELLHFIVQRQFHNFFSGYSKAFNKRHNRKGSLLRQNTRRKIVDNSTYVKNTIRYLHLNAIYHEFASCLEDWSFTSYHEYVGEEETFLPREVMLEWFGGKQAFIDFHEEGVDKKLAEFLEK